MNPGRTRWTWLKRATAGLAGLVAVVAIVVCLVTGPDAGWFGFGFGHAPRSSNEVALTFDDGLNGDTTREIAAILEAHGVRGTFFVVADSLAAQAPLARELRERGHLLANHSLTHPYPSMTDVRYDEVQRAQATFQQTIGACPRLFRPPYGIRTPFMSAAVHRAGMTMIGWDVSGHDWTAQDPAALVARVMDEVRPGSIILLHDGAEGRTEIDRSSTVRALPAIIDGLNTRGFKLVRVDEMLGKSGYLDRCP